MMKNIPILFIFLTLSAGASDTVFQSVTDPRLWDTAYMFKVFEDRFDGESLNTLVWHIDECRGRGNIPANNEGGSENIRVSDGTLKLIARYDPGNTDRNCWTGGFISDYTTAEIYSIRNRYLYGSFEARCKMPDGKGLFFAYWLWGKGDKDGFPKDEWASEIDIAENILNRVIHAFHYWPPEGPEVAISKGQKRIRKYPTGWHLYKIVWTPYLVEFFVDGKKTWERYKYFNGRDTGRKGVPADQIRPGTVYGVNEWFPRHACGTVFQMQLNNFIAGHEKEWLPAVMEIDYVRVNQFFKTPLIVCPDTLSSVSVALLDADPRASDVNWIVRPETLFAGRTSGTGTTAVLRPNGEKPETGTIVWTFRMPSGETFTVEKDFLAGTNR
jgi:beta-glucanase (GH16 family)